jgi:MFS family permease
MQGNRGKGFGIFDQKWLYIASIVMFSIGSAVCGAAPNMNALIVGRVIGGIGGAGMYLGLVFHFCIFSAYKLLNKLSVLNLLGRFTTIRERSGYYGILGFIWGAGKQCLVLYPQEDHILTYFFRHYSRACRRWRLRRQFCILALGILH